MFSHSRQGAIDVVGGNDPLNIDSCDQFRSAAESCFGHGPPRIIFDLSGIPYIDSAGLETLLDLRDRCQESSGVCKLAGPNHLCCDILCSTGMSLEFEIVDDVVQGAGSFTS
jgi:anti-anti-sigma factor